jgi:hypothetical protein
MSNKSDYERKFTNLYDLLPSVHKTDESRAIMENLFNRFLTKPELAHIEGYVGQGNKYALRSRQIIEATPDRQAYQLQPMLYSKIGSVEHMATWKDIQREMSRLGIDLSKMKEWLNLQKFNWVPPIDIDKLVNYRDYFWYDPNNLTDSPDYIVMRDLCQSAEGMVLFYQKQINLYGEQHPIIALKASDNSITIKGNLLELFVKGFIFYIKNSTNNDLNNAFWITSDASYDGVSDTTTIKILQNFSDDVNVDGIISLLEYKTSLETKRDCVCTGTSGWDTQQWDDNQLGTLEWNDALISAITHPTLNAWLAANQTTGHDIWFDTTTDSLLQHNSSLGPNTDINNWKIISTAFAVTLSQTTGTALWDFAEGCEFPSNAWVDSNKWIHKSVVPNFTIAKQAAVPIIEFNSYLEMNEWLEIEHSWEYRLNQFAEFKETNLKPSMFELKEVNSYNIENRKTLLLDAEYGDLSKTFVPNYSFSITNSTGSLYDVVHVLAGLGGKITVAGDASSDYVGQSQPNPSNLPTALTLKDSPNGTLDGVWNLENVVYDSLTDTTILEIISSESLVTPVFIGSKIFSSNNGIYTVDHSAYKHNLIEHQIDSYTSNNAVVVNGDLNETINFKNYLYIKDAGAANGKYEIVSKTYNTIIAGKTVVVLKENIPTPTGLGKIYINELKTHITINEVFLTGDGSDNGALIQNISDGSSLVPLKTSAGDNWVGYDKHWLYRGIKSIKPINHQYKLPILDLTNTPEQKIDSNYGNNSYNGYANNDLTYKINEFAQLFYVKKPAGVYKFELHSSLTKLARKGENSLRVYIQSPNDNNKLRQYGNYLEKTMKDITGSGDNVFVVAIEFDPLSPITLNSTVVIESGAATFGDIGNDNVSVRTERDDQIYDVSGGDETVSLYQFKINEQVKKSKNQYPLFDLYDINGKPLNRASEIFTFKESPESKLDINTQKRIVIESSEYIFEQHLLDEDDGEIFTYRKNDERSTDYYVNTDTNTVYVWTGNAWSENIFVDGTLLTPITSKTQPVAANQTQKGQVWYNPNTKKLFVHNGTSFVENAVLLSSVDPTLKSIWVPGPNGDTYEPKYVDGKRDEVPINDPAGDWEIPDPLYYNVHHENRKEIKMNELISHFKTIIAEQDRPVGISAPPEQSFHLLDAPNYSRGGKIREYNGSFDTMLSSIFVNMVTPTGVIEFAQNQYDIMLNGISNTFNDNILDMLLDTTATTPIPERMSEKAIHIHETNDIYQKTYALSPTFDDVNKTGIKHWVPTLPFIKLAEAKQPFLTEDRNNGVVYLLHHDGHYTKPEVHKSTERTILTALQAAQDARGQAGTSLVAYSTNNPPDNTGAFFGAFGAQKVYGNKYWFQTNVMGSVVKKYVLNIKFNNSLAPTTGMSLGDFWFNNGTGLLYVYSSTGWNTVSGISGQIKEAWKLFSLESLLGETLLIVENKLYDAVDKNQSVIDVAGYINSDPIHRDKLYKSMFTDYLKERLLDNPFVQSGRYLVNDPLTWNYISSIMPDAPYSGYTQTTQIGGDWKDLYYKIFGTFQPHLEPWTLQGYNERPDWWMDNYVDTTGLRVWNYDHATQTGMWDNILKGIVPVGKFLPNGEVSTGIAGEVRAYNYLPINIGDVKVDRYNSDDLLPPFWDFRVYFGANYLGPIRSLYYDFANHIIRPSSDFEPLDRSPSEFEWWISSQRLYDEIKMAFIIQPVKFFQEAFGIETNTICDLQVSKLFKKVYSHKNGLFHGDIVNNNEIYKINGINQWYTNYVIFNGFDANASDFKRLWSGWTSPLTYQFGSLIDTESFNMLNENFDLNKIDFNTTIKKSLGFKEMWTDALKVTTLSTPLEKLSRNVDFDWEFSVGTVAPINRDKKYFGVKKFQVFADPVSNSFRINKFKIEGLVYNENVVYIDGNFSHIFDTTQHDPASSTDQLTIESSTGNDGTYTIKSARYNEVSGKTEIELTSQLPVNVLDGYITSSYNLVDWNTGDVVHLSSEVQFPSPFSPENAYYVIKITSVEFQLASTKQQALDNQPIQILNHGVGLSFVGKLERTFHAFSKRNTDKAWAVYETDKTKIRIFNDYFKIKGLQHLIDFVFGYSSFNENEGWDYNFESVDVDNETGRLIDWQHEIERFIDNIFQDRKIKSFIPQKYQVSVDTNTNELTFLDGNVLWRSGTKVYLDSNGTMPTPLLDSVVYYVIDDRIQPNKIRLADSVINAKSGNAINLSSIGSGTLEIREYFDAGLFKTYEINPMRNNIWVNTKQGVVANIITGPHKDTKADQTIYDQYGRLLDVDKAQILRQDKISKIFIQPDHNNDLEILKNSPLDNIHIGGVHIFIDGYEHVVIYENYSTEGFLIYDPYIGLNTPKFGMVFDRQREFTLRPNIGGRFLHKNQKLVHNIESKTLDLQKAYDTYTTSESNVMTTQSRKTIGYTGNKSYLDALRVNDKSQFLFWKGMIQAKGSVSAITAFINSRRFVDAKVDEFWAYKIGEFGDAKTKQWPELNLKIKDALSNEVKFNFDSTPLEHFTSISAVDETRWFNYPSQRSYMKSLGNVFYFSSDVKEESPTFLYKVNTPIQPGDLTFTSAVGTLTEGNDFKLLVDSSNNGEVVEFTVDVREYGLITPSLAGSWFIKTEKSFDDVSILKRLTGNNSDTATSNVVDYDEPLVEGTDFEIVNGHIVKFLINPTSLNGLRIYTQIPAFSKHNPLKLIDKKAGVVIETFQFWEPERGEHYKMIENMVDFENHKDVATYNSSSEVSNINKGWTDVEVGRVWLDAKSYGYVPYNDTTIYADIDERIRLWGRLAEWSDVKIYQWTESDISPDKWDELAKIEEKDTNIPSDIRKTGRVLERVYKRTFHDPNGILPDQFSAFLENKILVDSIKSFNPAFTWVLDTGLQLKAGTLVELKKVFDKELARFYECQYYINGFAVKTDIILENEILNGDTYTFDVKVVMDPSLISGIQNADHVKLIHFGYDKKDKDGTRIYPTKEEIDDGLYKIETPHSKITKTLDDGTEKTTYFFWVESKTILNEHNITLKDLKGFFGSVPTSFGILQGHTDKGNDEFGRVLPDRYDKLIIKGLAGRVNENERYVLRICHNFTLRDDINDYSNELSLKNNHEQWVLIREAQPFHIRKDLWDKVTESMIGETFDGSPVPSLDRIVYDSKYNTSTQYGLGKGQAFVNKDLAIATFKDDLFNPNNDFQPVDINSFLTTYNFDTKENIKLIMDAIYNNFRSDVVNRLFFSVLHDALTTQKEFAGLFKTSAVSIHGIRILESAGLFDD